LTNILIVHLFVVFFFKLILFILAMARGKPLSEREKGKIDAYKTIGKSNRQIAGILKRSPHVIDNYVRDPLAYGTAKSPGRPPKTTPRLKRLIVRKMSAKRSSTRKVANDLPVKMSKDTVHRVAKESTDLVYKKLKAKPPLTDQHKQARRDFARENMATNWNEVIVF
jgi:transposase